MLTYKTETSTASTLLFSIDGLDCFTTWFDEVISCSNVCRQYTCGYASFWWAFHCIVLRIPCPKHDMAINRVTNNQKIWQGIKFGKFGGLPPFATAWFQMIACRDVSGFIRSSFRWESGSIMDVTVMWLDPGVNSPELANDVLWWGNAIRIPFISKMILLNEICYLFQF